MRANAEMGTHAAGAGRGGCDIMIGSRWCAGRYVPLLRMQAGRIGPASGVRGQNAAPALEE